MEIKCVTGTHIRMSQNILQETLHFTFDTGT